MDGRVWTVGPLTDRATACILVYIQFSVRLLHFSLLDIYCIFSQGGSVPEKKVKERKRKGKHRRISIVTPSYPRPPNHAWLVGWLVGWFRQRSTRPAGIWTRCDKPLASETDEQIELDLDAQTRESTRAARLWSQVTLSTHQYESIYIAWSRFRIF
jgi:hypothetical protein